MLSLSIWAIWKKLRNMLASNRCQLYLKLVDPMANMCGGTTTLSSKKEHKTRTVPSSVYWPKVAGTTHGWSQMMMTITASLRPITYLPSTYITHNSECRSTSREHFLFFFTSFRGNHALFWHPAHLSKKWIWPHCERGALSGQVGVRYGFCWRNQPIRSGGKLVLVKWEWKW